MEKELEIISLIKEAASQYNDEELLLIAQKLEKNAGLGLYETLQAAKAGVSGLGKGITSAVSKVAPGAANVLSHDLGSAAANLASKAAPVATKTLAPAGVNFMHQGQKTFMSHADLAKKSTGFQDYVKRNMVK